MNIEMKSRMRATAPLTSSKSVYAFQVDTRNQKWHKCWYCKNLSHWPDTCPKFAALGIDQRIRVAKKTMSVLVAWNQQEESIELITEGDVKSVQNLTMEGNACNFIIHCFTRARHSTLACTWRPSPSQMKLFCR